MPSEIWKPNVVVAAVAERDGKFLLVEEEVHDGRLVFNQPAGHWDPGETLVEACVRETLEETAHAFRPTALLGVFSWTLPDSDKTYLRFAFCGEVGERDPARKLDKEIRQALWLSLDEIRACRERHRSPLLMLSIERYLGGVRYPLDLIEHYA
ncbi:MAG TPA: NUDIX hydrolase [Burkholderiales bacterium]|nr:NUDIX hydrolase [Burkholderiales bacterium]